MIAKSLYLQCDPDGNQYVLLEDIADHHRRLLTAVSFPTRKLSVLMARPTLSTQPLVGNSAANGKMALCLGRIADLKESHPIEAAEYARIIGIDHEPAFNWWVPHVLRKRDHITSLVRK
jgi:hypothetical protein